MAGIVLLLLGLAAAEYIGRHHFYRYERERAGVRSIEAGFPRLEASLKKAVRFSGRTEFRKEMVRLYMEMALAENEFGTPAGRDAFLERAEASAREWIRSNPVDYRAYYEMGKIFLLYNFPLLTYAERGRDYLRKAVELKPADEFLNLNVLYIFMTQWDFLEEAERDFTAAQWGLLTKNSASFEKKLRKRWQENFDSTDKLDAILSRLQQGLLT